MWSERQHYLVLNKISLLESFYNFKVNQIILFNVEIKLIDDNKKNITRKFPRQSFKRFSTFRVKSSDSIFFLLGLSPTVNQFDLKSKSFKWKTLFNLLRIL